MGLERLTEAECVSLAPRLFETKLCDEHRAFISPIVDALLCAKSWYSLDFNEEVAHPVLARLIRFFDHYSMNRTELLMHVMDVCAASVLQYALEKKGLTRKAVGRTRIKRVYSVDNKRFQCKYSPFGPDILEYVLCASRAPVPSKIAPTYEMQVLHHTAKLSQSMFDARLIALAHRIVEFKVVHEREPGRFEEYKKLSHAYLQLFPEPNVLSEELLALIS